jgi:hypothetical protein
MNRKSFAAAFALLLARPAYGQVVNLWPGAAPGSEHWTQQERAVENTPIGTVFLAWAQDDPLVLDLLVRFRDALSGAGHKPEIHVFSAGGHGFGMRQQGTSSDHWIDAFYYWLQAQGPTRP